MNQDGTILKAPFPAFGGKSRVASMVWPRLSTERYPARNYVEPFCFSAAMLLLRPDEPKIETINDLNAFVANFWRAIQRDPEAVAAHADWPVNECLPAGTMIATPSGDVPIENIRPGMTVLGTEDGRVVRTRVAATRASVASDFLVRVGPLLLTGNHPVWTKNRGYIEAQYLSGADELGVLHHGTNLDHLHADGPSHKSSAIHRRHVSRQGEIPGTSIAGCDQRQDASGLLDSQFAFGGSATGTGGGRNRYRRLAGSGATVDCPLSSAGKSSESYGRRGGNARLHSIGRDAGDLVSAAEGKEIRSRSSVRYAGQESLAGCGGEDSAGRYRTTSQRGGEAENLSSQERQASCQRPSAETFSGPSRQGSDRCSQEGDCGNHDESKAGGVPGNRGGVCIGDGGRASVTSLGIFRQSSDPQRVPLQGQPLPVYNFQTATGNYFAGGLLVHNCDLHARHAWLVRSHEAAERLLRVRDEPDYFDAKIAGWWCWGACMWIGSGWCEQQIPHMSNQGQGVNSPLTQQIPHMDQSRGIIGGPLPADAENLKRPQFCNGSTTYGQGVHKKPILTSDGGTGDKGINSITNLALHQKRPCFPDGAEVGRGVQGYRQVPELAGAAGRPQLADAYSRGRGVHGNDTLTACDRRRLWLTNWFVSLADRLRPVRVCCGHWNRVCDSDSTLTRLGTTAAFLDPPYRIKLADGSANRTSHIYANDKGQDLTALVDEVQAWCLKWGGDKEIRIAVCGLEGEYPELDAAGWEKVAWKSQGGYGNRNKQNDNAARERIWFSPHCIQAKNEHPLFKESA